MVLSRDQETFSCALVFGDHGGNVWRRQAIRGPGEVTLAHHGILFLDEFPEFRRELIEMFRTVLEGAPDYSDQNGKNVTFPADFILIAAANPLPLRLLS